jgi:carbon-monoxide dehydrogenase small subunit
MSALTLRVNGIEVTRNVAPRTHLADFVREELNLTGTHIGCEHGVCGACTMMVDGRPVRSCLSYAVACAGSDVRTVEGFDDDPVMALLRDAFSRHHALQCGYCTPGMLATAYDVVTRLPEADEARIREELSGNLCRCTGYVGIVAAIKDVLARGPHLSALRAATPAATTTTWSAGIAMPAASASAETFAAPDKIEGGVTLSRSIAVPVPVDRLWTTLKDINTVARCLPGAALESIAPDGGVTGAFHVAIGPMRARFGGMARVTFDDIAHSGEVRGAGGDRLSRSRAEGAIRFTAAPEDDAGSRLALDMTYKLSGPLTQFGRPAVVAGVIDQLLETFAKNLAKASQGEAIVAPAPIRGAGLLFGLFRRLFSRAR